MAVEPKFRLGSYLFQCPTPYRHSKSRLRRQGLRQDPGGTMAETLRLAHGTLSAFRWILGVEKFWLMWQWKARELQPEACTGHGHGENDADGLEDCVSAV
jgi:hypothetical protein